MTKTRTGGPGCLFSTMLALLRYITLRYGVVSGSLNRCLTRRLAQARSTCKTMRVIPHCISLAPAATTRYDDVSPPFVVTSVVQVMHRLVIQGAFVDLPNAAGHTPIDIANMYNVAVPVELLAACNFSLSNES